MLIVGPSRVFTAYVEQVLPSALTYDLSALEKLAREHTSAIHALAEELTRQAVEREIARRATDEA